MAHNFEYKFINFRLSVSERLSGVALCRIIRSNSDTFHLDDLLIVFVVQLSGRTSILP